MKSRFCWILVAFALFLGGCVIPKPCFLKFHCNRRPPVQTNWENWVLDYCPEDGPEDGDGVIVETGCLGLPGCRCSSCREGDENAPYLCNECGAQCCKSCYTSGCMRCSTAACKTCGAHCCPKCSDSGCKECGNGGFPESYFDPYAPWEKEYRVKVGDILEISVFGDEDTLIDSVVVAPDGYLYYTLILGFPVKGRTLEEVTTELSNRLSPLFVNPMVVVSLKFTTTRNFKILGRVMQSGVYPLTSQLRVRQAIAMAGGISTNTAGSGRSWRESQTRVTINANLEKSFLVREDKKLKINFEKLLTTNDESENIYLRPGDYIFIAPLPNRYIYMLGTVAIAQRVVWEDGMTLMRALGRSAGWRRGADAYSADLQHLLVIRGSLECPCYIEVNLMDILRGQARDVHLKPGDIVYSQEKPFQYVRATVRMAVNTFVSSFANAAGQYYGSQWFAFPALNNTNTPDDGN